MNRLTLIRAKVKKQGKNWLNEYLCECGNTCLAASYNIGKKINSCGCIKREILEQRNTTHGLSNENLRLYGIWKAMRKRCNNPKSSAYEYYGGRGIKVCVEWNEYPSFYKWATSNGYADNLSIDRKEVDGKYEPSNCRWVTNEIQVQSTTISVGEEKVKYIRNSTKPMTELAKELGIDYSTIKRIKYRITYKNIA